VGAHLGLTPARYQSGETDIQGKVSRCGGELARTALYEAAHALLVRSKKWSSLRAWGMKVAKHRGPVGSADIPPGDRAKPDGARPRRGRPQARRRPAPHTTNSPGRANQIVPAGTMGETISLSVPSWVRALVLAD
jgi:hypothetical protein